MAHSSKQLDPCSIGVQGIIGSLSEENQAFNDESQTGRCEFHLDGTSLQKNKSEIDYSEGSFRWSHLTAGICCRIRPLQSGNLSMLAHETGTEMVVGFSDMNLQYFCFSLLKKCLRSFGVFSVSYKNLRFEISVR